MPLNWDRIANEFADHDLANDRIQRRFSKMFETEIKQAKHIAEGTLAAIPTYLKEHLAKCRAENRPAGQWLRVLAWSHGQETSLAAANIVENKLSGKVRTKRETGGDETYTGHELYLNIEDLQKHALKHINRPPFQPGKGPQMPGTGGK